MSVEEKVVDVLRGAYFHKVEPMKEMADKFIRLRNDIAEQQRADETDPKRRVVKLLMCFLRSTLVTGYNRLGGDNHSLTSNVLCNIHGFPKFADAINDSGDYVRWTHIILSLASYLRLRTVPVVKNGELNYETVQISKEFIYVCDNARLLFYGILFCRLCSYMFRQEENARDRFNIEMCLFMSIISFYADFVHIQKARPETIDKTTFSYWKTLYGQVNAMYVPSNSVFFTQLKLGNVDLQTRSGPAIVDSLKSYLSQDTVNSAQDCIVIKFLHQYRGMIMKDSSVFDLDPVRKCLNNMQAFRFRMSRWFRNNILENIRFAGNQIVAAAGQIYKIGSYAKFFATEYPVVTAVGTVAFALAIYHSPALAQKAIESAVSKLQSTDPYTLVKFGTGIAAGATTLAGLRTAWLIVFKDPELQTAPSMRTTIKNETAHEPPFLELVTSTDGLINTIYRVAPLPAWPYKTPDPHPHGFAMRPPIGGAPGIKVSAEVQQLKNCFKRGYIRDELPPEMQRYILSKNIVKRGGAAPAAQQDKYGDDIPPSYRRQRLVEPSTPDNVKVSVEGQTVKLTVPNTPLQTEALDAGFIIDTPDPASEGDTGSARTMTKHELVERGRAQNIPLPPVLPSGDTTAASKISDFSSSSSVAYLAAPYYRRSSRTRSRSKSRSRSRSRRTSLRRPPLKKSRSRSRSRGVRRNSRSTRRRSSVRYGSYRRH